MATTRKPMSRASLLILLSLPPALASAQSGTISLDKIAEGGKAVVYTGERTVS